MISVEELIPKDHILRKIDKYIDFDFIYDLVEDKYCLDNGRPSIDPLVLFKIIFIQYLFNIKSMRQTIKEIEVNIAYRWFLGFDFYDKIPHFTTFSQNYRRRFKDTKIFEEIFANILGQAMDKGFVDSKIQFVDATHVKAHANRHKNKREEIKVQAKAYQGVIVLGVDEKNRAWTTSSSWCDNRAITIEVGNSTRGPQWLVSDYVLNRLIDLVTDICKRNGIKNCTYTGGKDGVLQKHEWYSNTNCPGPY